MEDEECGQDAHAPCEEAIRQHLRPELVNRLTKIMHFNPLGMDATREIVGKLLTQLNARISDRVMDRLLGTLIADALLSGELIKGQIVRLKATDGANSNLAGVISLHRKH